MEIFPSIFIFIFILPPLTVQHYYMHICPLRRRQKSEHVQEIELNKYYLNKSQKNHI